MNDFTLWFTTGLEHIADWKGYDHILFLLALCGMYEWQRWKQLLVLVTAFTVGHSLTLALSVLDLISPHTAFIEFLIPVTILATCVYNLRHLEIQRTDTFRPNYVLPLFFGLIHGMGFSFLLKSLLGAEENVVWPLLAFNLGVEAGQLLIVVSVLLISLFLTAVFRIKRRNRNFFISSAVFGIASMMAIERAAALFE